MTPRSSLNDIDRSMVVIRGKPISQTPCERAAATLVLALEQLDAAYGNECSTSLRTDEGVPVYLWTLSNHIRSADVAAGLMDGIAECCK